MKLMDVIEYEGSNDVLVAKAEVEDFKTKSKLIVNESQEALFFKNGQALDLFPSGKYSLTTDNIPVISKVFNKLLYGGKEPFSCQVYFINKVNVLDIIWGTDSPITVEDPKYRLIVNVRANGTMGVRVTDSRKFVLKIVGQLPEFSVDNLRRQIKGTVMAYVKNAISNTIVNQGVSILEVSTRMLDLSKGVEQLVNRELEEYGIELTKFFINTINAPDNDLAMLRRTREKQMQAMSDIDIEAYKTERMGQAMARSREAQGYTYQQERQFDVLEGAANNQGASGTMMNASMGMGMGFGLAGQVNSQMNQAMNPQPQAQPQAAPQEGMIKCSCGEMVKSTFKFCPVCGNTINKNKFCPECGNKLEGTVKFCPECGFKF